LAATSSTDLQHQAADFRDAESCGGLTRADEITVKAAAKPVAECPAQCPQALPSESLQTVREEAMAPSQATATHSKDSALSHLEDARLRCGAHMILLHASGVVSTLLRLLLTASLVSLQIVSAGFVVLLVFPIGTWQLVTLMRNAFMALPWPSPNRPARRGCDVLDDLRVFSYSTVLCEILVIGIAAGVVGPDLRGSFSVVGAGHAGRGGYTSAAFGSQAFGGFVLEQVALSFVLTRLYFAWLAHSLHKWQVNLTFAVLPESPRPELLEANDSDAPRPHFDTFVPAWTPAAITAGAKYELHVAARRRFRCQALLGTLGALMLVLAVAVIIIRRTHEAGTRASSSSCRTAARGTDFCVKADFLGLFEDVASIDDCCDVCDATPGCQAWTFSEAMVTGEQSGRGRCWKMSFLEAPCRDRPGHFSCRCHTSSNRFGGYKSLPGDVVWSGE